MPTLRHRCLAALATADIDDKLAATHDALNVTDVGANAMLVATATLPGRPERPLLVLPNDVPQRSLSTVPGRAALIHALAHIQFNAVNTVFNEAIIYWPFVSAHRRNSGSTGHGRIRSDTLFFCLHAPSAEQRAALKSERSVFH